MSGTEQATVAVKHYVKAVKGERMAGSWVGVCSCGWRGDVQGLRGARSRALSEAWVHEYRAEQGS